MSGIGGIFNSDGAPVSKNLLEVMSRALLHRGKESEGLRLWENAGLFCRQTRVTPESSGEVQPEIHPAGPALVFDGRLDNREELLAMVGKSSFIHPGCPDTRLILEAFLKFGNAFTERLKGDFALALYHPHEKKLLLARDAIGVRPLYYCRIKQCLIFASEIKSLLSLPFTPCAPDDSTLASFIFANTLVDFEGKTVFKDIYSVPPGHVISALPDRFAIRQYWDFEIHDSDMKATPETCFGQFGDLFSKAVKNRMRSSQDIALSLSGGLDSSAIFCAAQSLIKTVPGLPGILPLTYTSTDGSAADETEFILSLEEQYHIPVRRLGLSEPSLLFGSRELVWHSETPFLDELWTSSYSLLDAARNSGAGVLLTGHWGDQVLVNQSYLVDLFKSGRWQTIRNHLASFKWWCQDVSPAHFNRGFLSDMIRHNLPETVLFPIRKLRRKFIRQDPNLDFYEHLLWDHFRFNVTPRQKVQLKKTAHAESLYRIVRSQSNIRWMEWNNKTAAMFGLDIAFPFLDRDLISFLMNTPGDIISWQGTPKGIMREALKDLLPIPIKNRRWKGDFTQTANDGVKNDYLQITELLSGNPKVAEKCYINREALLKNLTSMQQRMRSTDCEVTWALSGLLGLEIWLRTFFNGKTP